MKTATRVKIEFFTQKASFDGENLGPEIARSLEELANRLKEQSREFLLNNGSKTWVTDCRGNIIGKYKLSNR